MIKLGLPKEQRLRQKISSFLGILNETQILSRNTFCETATVRTGDVFTDCMSGFLDAGVTSSEVLAESILGFPKYRSGIEKVTDKLVVVPFSVKPWSVCCYTWKDRYFDPNFHSVGPGVSIASEFPLISRLRYFFSNICPYEGCVEARVLQRDYQKPSRGMHEYGVGIVDTGESLKRYNLKVVDKIMEVRPLLLFGSNLLRDKLAKKAISDITFLFGSSLSKSKEIDLYNLDVRNFFYHKRV